MAVAVIGCGHWGRNLVRNFARIGALAAVSDASTAAAQRMSEIHGVPARSVEDILADSAIEAVAVATPAASHEELASMALRAGKHVFVEKPLAMRTKGAESLCDEAQRLGRTLMVGHLLQYHPAFVKLQEIIRVGAIGRLQYLYSNRLNLGRIRREEDILWSFAPHDISMILSLVRSAPDLVTTVGARYLHKTIADVTTTHLSFPGGEQAHIFVSWLHPFKEQKLIVVGDDGMIVFDDANPWETKLVVFGHRIDWREGLPNPVRAEGRAIPVEEAEPLEVECRHFVHCATTGQRPRSDGDEGVRVLRVLEAASESLAFGHGVACEARVSRESKTVVREEPVDHDTAVRDDYFVHDSAYVDDGVVIGPRSKIWHFSHILSGTRIGAECTVGQNVMIGPDVTVGSHCKIQNNVSVYEGVTLEDGVFCGPSCVFTNVKNPRAEITGGDRRPTVVRRGATIGANATIVCGHEVGSYALIAAGAVVTRDVPAHALMVGVPARRVAWVSHSGQILGDDLVCPSSGRRYVLIGTDELRALEG